MDNVFFQAFFFNSVKLLHPFLQGNVFNTTIQKQMVSAMTLLSTTKLIAKKVEASGFHSAIILKNTPKQTQRQNARRQVARKFLLFGPFHIDRKTLIT
jgi:hypothetical protein